jgi:hypothetical protein
MTMTSKGLLAPMLAATALLFVSLTSVHAASGAAGAVASVQRLAAAQAGAPEGTPTNASLQVAHLAPFASGAGSSVTVALNGAPALTNVLYGDSTAYIELPPGAYTVDIIPTGAGSPAITANAVLAAGGFYTAIAVGDGGNQPLSLVLLEDNPPPPAPGEVLLRLGHLAPFAAGAAVLADVRLQDGTPILEGVTFTDVSGFLPLPAGSYDLTITAPGGAPVLIDPLPVTLAAGQVLSAFATGDGDNQPLGAFALPVGAPGAFLPLGTPPPQAPVVRPVPTAGTWAMLALALALLALAAAALRRRRAA